MDNFTHRILVFYWRLAYATAPITVVGIITLTHRKKMHVFAISSLLILYILHSNHAGQQNFLSILGMVVKSSYHGKKWYINGYFSFI